MTKKLPYWKKIISSELFGKAFKSTEMQNLVKKASKEYVYWDKFKHYPPPKGFSIDEAWAYLKFSRMTNQEGTPVLDINKKPFNFNLTKAMYSDISFIDSNTSGFLRTSIARPSESQKNQLIISGLSEEAIASSQIEGANTSRKVAKEMILSQRKPRNKDEQMIINNYQVMQRLMAWKDLPLSKSMLLDIQNNITTKTLEDESDVGRLRKDEDNIHIIDSTTGLAVFTPPPVKMLEKELDKLMVFANQEDEDFIHPTIKASILHFWLAYLHPFVDGNGRTARAIFYWYLLKKEYWLFQYLSISRAIKKSRVQYYNAYLNTEEDDNDLTYFILYSLKVIKTAVEDFTTHYKKKVEEEKKNEELSKKMGGFNERQVALLSSLNRHPEKIIDIKTHQSKNQIAYQTSRTDLIQLAGKGLLTQMADGRKYVFIPNTKAIKQILKIEN